MARTDRARPARTIRFISGHEADGTPILVEHRQEFGRRAGLHTRKSQASYGRRLINRRDRHDARAQLRRDPDSVELRQPRHQAVWLSL